MKTSVAVISIIVEDSAAVGALNELLHEYSDFIIGRMGIPYRAKDVNIICIAMDAPAEKIDALAAALAGIKGINAKAVYSNV